MPLKGKTVYIAREDAPLPPGGYFLQDLLDARVVLGDGSPVGVLTEILERPANNVYVVTDPEGKEILIPAVPAFILSADAEEGVVTVRLLEGM
jgi:16S rRNA processing protein RimM